MTDNIRTALAFGGYAAKTIVYCLLGILVIGTAIGNFRQDTPSQKSVFIKLVEQPFGQVILGIVIVGMACYVLWRLSQALFNIDKLDDSAKDVLKRVFYFVSAIIYASGTYLAIKVFQGARSDGGGQNSSEQMSSTLMQQTWGLWLVGLCGVIVILFSFIQFKHAIKSDFMDKFDLHKMSAKAKSAAEKVGRVGFFARGVIYIMVGGFFVSAALAADPEEAGGLRDALNTLMQQSYGQYAVMFIGAGLFLFGIFCAFESRYHKT